MAFWTLCMGSYAPSSVGSGKCFSPGILYQPHKSFKDKNGSLKFPNVTGGNVNLATTLDNCSKAEHMHILFHTHTHTTEIQACLQKACTRTCVVALT